MTCSTWLSYTWQSPPVQMKSPTSSPACWAIVMREQRVRSDVERDAQEKVGAALVQLARKLPVGDVELEERVARRQRHLRISPRSTLRRCCDASRDCTSASRWRRRSGRRGRPTVSATTAIGRRRPGPGHRSRRAHRPRLSRRGPAASARWNRRAGTRVSHDRLQVDPSS